MLQARWIVVHTHADPFARGNPSWSEMSFAELCHTLQEQVTKAMEEVTQTTFQATHIFVENMFKERDEALKAMFVEAMNSFHLAIAAFEPIPIGNLFFQKSEKQRAIDQRLKTYLETKNDGLKARSAELQRELVDELEPDCECLMIECAKLQADVESQEEKLQDIKSEDEMVAESVTVWSKSQGCFSYPRAHATFRLEGRYCCVATLNGNPKSCFKPLQIEYQQITPSSGESQANIMEVCVVGHCLLCHFGCTISVTCKKKDFYKNRIPIETDKLKRLKSSQEFKRDRLHVLEPEVQRQRGAILSNDQEQQVVNNMLHLLKNEWTLSTYKTFHYFYSLPVEPAVEKFVSTACHEAKLQSSAC